MAPVAGYALVTGSHTIRFPFEHLKEIAVMEYQQPGKANRGIVAPRSREDVLKVGRCEQVRRRAHVYQLL